MTLKKITLILAAVFSVLSLIMFVFVYRQISSDQNNTLQPGTYSVVSGVDGSITTTIVVSDQGNVKVEKNK